MAIAHRVHDARSSPHIGCLVPHIKVGYEVGWCGRGIVCACVCVSDHNMYYRSGMCVCV